jgi:hypothetical protein
MKSRDRSCGEVKLIKTFQGTSKNLDKPAPKTKNPRQLRY